MKQHISNFDDFVIESAIKQYDSYLKTNYKVEIVNALIKSGSLHPETLFVMESAVSKNMYNELWEGSFNEEFINENLNETKFSEWIQNKAEKAKELIKSGAQRGKEAIVKTTAQLLSSFSTFAGKIIQGIKAGLVKVFKFVKGATDSVYKEAEKKVVAKGVKTLQGKGNDLTKEAKQMGDMVKGGIKWCTGGAADAIGKDVKEAGAEEVSDEKKTEEAIDLSFYNVILHESILQSINTYGKEFIDEIMEFNSLYESEESLNESGDEAIKIPGLSKLSKIIAKLPFVKQLHDVEHAAAKATNSGLERTSIFLNKIGASGGPYKFGVLGVIAGLFIGLKVKEKLGGMLESEDMNESDDAHGGGMKKLLIKAGISGAILLIMVTMPGIGVVVKILKKVAQYYWYWTVAQVIAGLLKQSIKGDDEEAIDKAIEDGHKESKEEVKDTVKDEKEEEDKDKEKDKEEKK